MKTFINLLLILILNPYLVNDIEFEELLGKHLSAVEKTVDANFRNSNYEQMKIHLYFSQDFNMDFLGMFSHALSVETGENDIVESITVHFNEVIDRQFYDSFLEMYGEPNSILVIDKRHVISESSVKDESGNITQHLSKGELDLKEGTFDEKPLFMIWEKEDFYIQAFLRHESNISEITFSVDSPRFNLKPSKKN